MIAGQLIAHLGTDVDDADHVGKFRARRNLEPAVRFFHRTRRRKGPEGLALLYHGIDAVAHLGVPGIGQDAAIAERARSVLHASARPRDHAPVGDKFGCRGAGFVRRRVALPLNFAVEALQRGLDLDVAILRSEERNGKTLVGNLLCQCRAIERRAQRHAIVAGHGLNVDLVEKMRARRACRWRCS